MAQGGPPGRTHWPARRKVINGSGVEGTNDEQNQQRLRLSVECQPYAEREIYLPILAELSAIR